MTSARILCDDPTSRNLLFALRFMGFDTEQAMSVFQGLAPDFATDAGVQQRFRSAYGAIGVQEAADRVRRWQLEELESLVSGQKAANTQTEPVSTATKGAA